MNLPFPVTSSPGRVGQEGGGRLVNCYANEVQGAPASPVLWQRVAGSRRMLLIPDAAEDVIGARGFVSIGQVLLHHPADQCYAITESGGSFSYNLLGPLDGTQPLTFGQNNKQPTPETVCVTETGAFLLDATSAPTPLNEPNLPSVNSVTDIDTYHIYSTPGGRIYASSVNDKTVPSDSWLPLPEGNLSRVVEYNNELFAFGNDFFRVYRTDPALATQPFPLAYTGVKRDVGIASTWAVAGFEEGFPNAMIFAGSDDKVYQMIGYNPQPISTEDVQKAIEDADSSQLVASVYSSGGQAFWTLTYPGFWTWEYNLDTGLWHERESYERSDYRGRSSIFFFDRWITGDAQTANLFQTEREYPIEFETVLSWVLDSGIVSAFPQRVNATRTFLRFTASSGLDRGNIPTQTNPHVRVFISRTGGDLYQQPIYRELGSEGVYDYEVVIGNSGPSNSKGLKYRLVITDTVNIGFMGAFAETETLAA